MLTAMALALAGPSGFGAPLSDAAFERMAHLYEDICLTAFPDDEAVASGMTANHARALSDDEARLVLHGDSGHGWIVDETGDRLVVVVVKSAPRHACVVRRAFARPIADPSAYRDAAARFRSIGPAFRRLTPIDREHDGIQSHIEGDGRVTNLGTEILLVATDARPDGSVEMRFVREIKR